MTTKKTKTTKMISVPATTVRDAIIHLERVVPVGQADADRLHATIIRFRQGLEFVDTTPPGA